MTDIRSTGKLAIDGGTPIRDIHKNPWPKWPVYGRAEEQILRKVLKSGQWWYVEGEHGIAFEQEFANFQESKYGISCSNGTAALEIVLRSLEIGLGDEVIVPPYTFIATASTALMTGATAVFADIDRNTLNISPDAVEKVITSRTRAIICVHIAGRPADMDRLIEIAKKHNIYLIEDAAQAHGAAWRGRRVGSLGDLGTFSFQASKNLNSGEGGIILSNDEHLADAAWSVMNVGRVRSGKWYEHRFLGGNFRITEFQAAILRAQMTRLPDQIVKRERNAALLRSRLSALKGIILPSQDERISTHANHLFTFRLDLNEINGRSRDMFVKALHAEGIPALSGYVPLYKEALFQCAAVRKAREYTGSSLIDYPNLNLPECEQVCKDSVWLMQQLLLGTKKDMEDIAEAISRIMGEWMKK